MNKHSKHFEAYNLHDLPRTSQYVILSLRYRDIFSHLSLLVTSSLHVTILVRVLMRDISESLSYNVFLLLPRKGTFWYLFCSPYDYLSEIPRLGNSLVAPHCIGMSLPQEDCWNKGTPQNTAMQKNLAFLYILHLRLWTCFFLIILRLPAFKV
jgi:hypothetical protein